MQLIRLVTTDGDVVWVNADHIVYIDLVSAASVIAPESYPAVSRVTFVNGGAWKIAGTPDEIVRDLMRSGTSES